MSASPRTARPCVEGARGRHMSDRCPPDSRREVARAASASRASRSRHTRCSQCIAVNRAELETTAPIRRDELLGLLDAMAEPSATASSPSTGSRPKRSPAPFSQIAALLPPCELPRATRPPPIVRAKTASEQKAAQTVADARARLATADETAEERAALRERVSFPALSANVVAQLSGEEIAMLPMEMRLMLPAVPDWPAPPRIEITPVPGDAVFIHAMRGDEHDDSIRVTARDSARTATSVALFATALLALACAVYFLL